MIDSFIKANLEDKWNLIIVGGGGELHIEVVNYLKRKKFNNINRCLCYQANPKR